MGNGMLFSLCMVRFVGGVYGLVRFWIFCMVCCSMVCGRVVWVVLVIRVCIVVRFLVN